MDAAKRTGLWVLIALLSVATLVLYVDNSRTRDCIANYMTADQNNTTARSVVADRERAAFSQTLETIATNTDKDAREKAIEDYVALVQKDDIERKSHPVLPVPTECD